MNRFLFAIALCFVASAYGQGIASFYNRTWRGDWKVALPNGAGAGSAVPPLSVDLFLADSSGATPVGTPLASTTFRAAPAAATFFLLPIDEMVIPDAPPGSTAAKLVAVISGSGIRTELLPLIVDPTTPLMGRPSLPSELPGNLIPANLALFGSTLVLEVPEPTVISLVALGTAVFLLLRRKLA